MFVWKRPKINEKEAGGGLFFLKKSFSLFTANSYHTVVALLRRNRELDGSVVDRRPRRRPGSYVKTFLAVTDVAEQWSNAIFLTHYLRCKIVPIGPVVLTKSIFQYFYSQILFKLDHFGNIYWSLYLSMKIKPAVYICSSKSLQHLNKKWANIKKEKDLQIRISWHGKMHRYR